MQCNNALASGKLPDLHILKRPVEHFIHEIAKLHNYDSLGAFTPDGGED
jgi:hypothetical protein